MSGNLFRLLCTITYVRDVYITPIQIYKICKICILLTLLQILHYFKEDPPAARFQYASCYIFVV